MARENLLTNGGELNRPNGTDYKGKYHVHVSKGAMAGAKHSRYYHESLTPANLAAGKKIAAIMNELQEEETAANVPRPRGTNAQAARRASRRGQARQQFMAQRTTTPTPRRAPSRPAPSRRSGGGGGYGGGGGGGY